MAVVPKTQRIFPIPEAPHLQRASGLRIVGAWVWISLVFVIGGVYLLCGRDGRDGRMG